MTTAIQSFTYAATPRHQPTKVSVEAQHATELPTLDPATTAKLSQAQVFLDNMRHAWAKQSQAAMRHTAQLQASQQHALAAAVQLGLEVAPTTLSPFSSELLAHPEVLEDLKKQREREARLSVELDDSIDATRRPMMDLLRVLGFLSFGETREERPAAEGPPLIDSASKDASGLVWNSHSEFYEQIGLLLAALKQNWLSKYQDAMKKFLEFYQEFSDIMEDIKFDGVGDKGDVKMDFSEVQERLKLLMIKYGLSSGGLASFDSAEAAKAFKDSLGLPGLTIVSVNGKHMVMMDLSSVSQIIKSMNHPLHPDLDPVFTVDSAKYNAWVSAKDSNVEQIKHTSKVLGEKLSETTQQFDNIVKILSSTIDKITDADMSFVNGL